MSINWASEVYATRNMRVSKDIAEKNRAKMEVIIKKQEKPIVVPVGVRRLPVTPK